MHHLNSLMDAYLTARERVVEAGYGPEIDWQDDQRFDQVDEATFLREAGWVILSAGLAEAVVRRVFPSVSAAFREWSSARVIARHRDSCIAQALKSFAHRGKVVAIADLAHRVAAMGFAELRRCLAVHGAQWLLTFDYLGPATSMHLAKNLGLDVVKPDRHLLRAATAAGVESPDALCRAVSAVTGDRVATIDLVFWRYGTLHQDFGMLFPSCPSTPDVRED